MMSSTAKSFDHSIVAISLSILHNYFDDPKLFSELRPAKFLHILAKFFSLCIFLVKMRSRIRNSVKT